MGLMGRKWRVLLGVHYANSVESNAEENGDRAEP